MGSAADRRSEPFAGRKLRGDHYEDRRLRTRRVFERYAIVSRSDMDNAILKLQESEERREQERLQEQKRQAR